jgi:hypothetical protein
MLPTGGDPAICSGIWGDEQAATAVRMNAEQARIRRADMIHSFACCSAK